MIKFPTLSNAFFNSFSFLDLVDDYYSEKIRIQTAQRSNFRFSFGDYIVKILLGSIDKSLDNLDGSNKSLSFEEKNKFSTDTNKI